MGGGMSRIAPGIYVGGLTAAKSQIQLNKHEITHLCTVVQEAIHVDSSRKQIVLRADDSPDENLSRYFEDAVNFIHEARVSGGSVLIHCACGVSRSVTITLAYLLVVTEFSLADLFKAVQGARHCACPNHGFMQQLLEFEKSKRILQIRERLFSRFGPWPDEKRKEDSAELKAHLAAQDYFIANGVYPDEQSLDKASATSTTDKHEQTPNSSKPLPSSCYTVRVSRGIPRDLNEFLASRSPVTDATETETSEKR